MKVIVTSACISLCIHGHSWDWNWITFDNLKSIHFFDCSFGILNVFILNKCEPFALTCFWISVNIDIINFTKRLEKLFQLTFWHFCEFALQTSHLHFGQSPFLLSLLLIRIDLFGYFHLSKFKEKLLCSSCSSVFLSLRMLNFETSKLPSFYLNGSLFHRQSFFNRLRCIKLNVSDTFALSTSLVSNNSDVSDFSTLSVAEEIPNVFFFGFER